MGMGSVGSGGCAWGGRTVLADVVLADVVRACRWMSEGCSVGGRLRAAWFGCLGVWMCVCVCSTIECGMRGFNFGRGCVVGWCVAVCAGLLVVCAWGIAFGHVPVAVRGFAVSADCLRGHVRWYVPVTLSYVLCAMCSVYARVWYWCMLLMQAAQCWMYTPVEDVCGRITQRSGQFVCCQLGYGTGRRVGVR